MYVYIYECIYVCRFEYKHISRIMIIRVSYNSVWCVCQRKKLTPTLNINTLTPFRKGSRFYFSRVAHCSTYLHPGERNIILFFPRGRKKKSDFPVFSWFYCLKTWSYLPLFGYTPKNDIPSWKNKTTCLCFRVGLVSFLVFN